MSVITSREDFLKRITEVVGDDTSDESLTFIEDMTETYDKLSSNENEDWKQKYEENDANWRKKYKERFLNGSKEEDDEEDEEPPRKSPTTFEELFTTK